MRVLVVDVGGTHVKLMHSGSPEARKFDSGDGFTPAQVVAGVKATTADWKYDAITLGIPSPVIRGKVMEEPWNLGKGWVGFDWAAALGKPVKILNDAAMQALGSDEGGRMLFLGLGSGLGTALVDQGRVVSLELAHLPFKDQTFEDLMGQRGLKSLGEDRWRAVVLEGAELLLSAGPAGVRLIPREAWEGRASLRAVADVNAVPPLGIEGIEVTDNSEKRGGGITFGALGIGSLKMKIHKACIARLFERNDQVLDAETILDVARALNA